MARAPLPKGCFKATYPNTEWQQVPCTTPPPIPYLPARGSRSATVGNGQDFSAQVSGHISSAVGSFDSVAGVTFESSGALDSFSLQLNAKPFQTSICSGAAHPSDCLGWQQFLLAGPVFMQYWLLNYGKHCPTGWFPSGESDCVENSPGGIYVQSPTHSALPAPTIADLGQLSLTGNASLGGMDTVILSTGTDLYSVSNDDNVLNLAQGWQAAEFNIVGPGGGSRANFNNGSTIVVRTSVDDGTTNAPSCAEEGFTSETNSLTLVNPCTAIGGTSPAIVFTESSPAIAFVANESLLWSFGSYGTDGEWPNASLIMDAKGNLYGTTNYGGTYDGGAVFELTPPSTSGGNWAESILWSFDYYTTDGNYNAAGLIMDAKGNLYGTIPNGPSFYGAVFELTPPSTSGGNWTESILWNFEGGTDGAFPQAGLIMDAKGNLYGTTGAGGTYGESESGYGTVFELTPPSTSGGNWTKSTLLSFNGVTDGEYPDAGLIIDLKGSLYGTIGNGGTYQEGTVFELAPPPTGGGDWTESILWNFGHGTDGEYPEAGLIMDAAGNLYGTTAGGGTYDPFFGGGGTVFKLTPPSTSGGHWSESILWSFDGTDGVEYPSTGLVMDANGNLYGTAGTVFELTPPSASGGSWTESIVFDAGSEATLIADGSGNLYGTTEFNGTNGVGTVFEISNIPFPPPTPTPTPTSTPMPTATPTPTPAILAAAPAILNFGAVDATGISKPRKLTLINRGTSAAQISTITATAPFTISGSEDSCSEKTIAPRKKCSFEVEFAPTTIGNVTGGSIDVAYNGASPTMTLSGNGIAVTLKAPTAESFPTVPAGQTSKVKSITIANNSTVSVQIGAAGALQNFMVTSDHCANASLAPKGKCVVMVDFAPADGTSGALSSVLSYGFSYGANSGTVSVTLNGKVK